jgi:hypothetical protein
MIEMYLQLELCIGNIHIVFEVYLVQFLKILGKLFCVTIYTYYRVEYTESTIQVWDSKTGWLVVTL